MEITHKGLPEEFIAVLKCKVWGKAMNLLLFVEDEEESSKFCLSIFRRRDNKFYTPREMADFDLGDNEFQPGIRLLLKTRATKKGNTDLLAVNVM